MRRLKPYWAYYAGKARKTQFEGIEVYRPRFVRLPTKYGFPFHGLGMWLGLRSLLMRLKDSFDFDLIHAHTVYPDGMAAAWLGRQLCTPVVCTIHGSEVNIYPDETNLTRTVTQKAIKEVDRLVAVSEALKAKTLTLGTPKREICVIPNGVDTSKFAHRDRERAREELGLPKNGRVIVYASRLAEAKGLSFLLSALQMVLDYESCLLVLVGDGHYRDRLVVEVANLGLEDEVIFTGLVSHTEVASWMSASDLVVLPSLSEGSPLPLYEALASGRPIVASRVGGVPEIVINEEYGLLVPPADPDALAQALLRGLRKSWAHQRIREYGERYSWANVASQLMDVYQDLLNDDILALESMRTRTRNRVVEI
jgi:glycosyltransferase involved in cell wall biosynthesis